MQIKHWIGLLALVFMLGCTIVATVYINNQTTRVYIAHGYEKTTLPGAPTPEWVKSRN